MTARFVQALLLLAWLGGSAAHAADTKADAVIAAAKRATGGAAWDLPQGCIETGTHGDGAVTYRTSFSLRDYGMRVDSERGGARRSMGFNGKTPWQAGTDGKVQVRSDPDAVREAVVTNYLSVNGFFFPDRFPATFSYLREASEGGRAFDVVEITPAGGRAFEVWFDQSTHLIQRVVDTHGTPPVRVEASDYRASDGLTVAYQLDVFGPDGARADHGVLQSFRCGAVDTASFEPPAAR